MKNKSFNADCFIRKIINSTKEISTESLLITIMIDLVKILMTITPTTIMRNELFLFLKDKMEAHFEKEIE